MMRFASARFPPMYDSGPSIAPIAKQPFSRVRVSTAPAPFTYPTKPTDEKKMAFSASDVRLAAMEVRRESFDLIW